MVALDVVIIYRTLVNGDTQRLVHGLYCIFVWFAIMLGLLEIYRKIFLEENDHLILVRNQKRFKKNKYK